MKSTITSEGMAFGDPTLRGATETILSRFREKHDDATIQSLTVTKLDAGGGYEYKITATK